MKRALVILAVIACYNAGGQSMPVTSSKMAARIYAVAPPVTGKVTLPDGQPLAGVTITIKGATTGTETDENGNFTLDVQPGQVLVFSFVGYQDQEHVIGN